MASEPVHSRTADADVPARRRPAPARQYQGGGDAGRRFLVGRGDGEVIQLPLLLYLIMAAIAEGGVDGGWSADQVSARVGAASGQGLTADNVRYLIAGKLAPLGLIAADGADRPDGAPARGSRPGEPAAGLRISGLPLAPTGDRRGRPGSVLAAFPAGRAAAPAVPQTALGACARRDSRAGVRRRGGGADHGRDRNPCDRRHQAGAGIGVVVGVGVCRRGVGRRGQPVAGRGLGSAAGKPGHHRYRAIPACAGCCGGTGSPPPG